MISKKFFDLLYDVIVIQLLRIACKNVVFIFIKPNTIFNMILNSLFLIIMFIYLYYKLGKSNDGYIPIKGKKYSIIYYSLLLIIFLYCLIFLKNVSTFFTVISIAYCEEILFRGYIWNELINKSSKYINYILLTILYIVWNICFIDFLLYDNSFNYGYLFIIIKGLGFGLIAMLLKKKYNNIRLNIIINSIVSLIV